MLILTRKLSEDIRIGDDVTVRLISIHGGKAKIGIDAPKSVPVHRQEIYERIHGESHEL